jgi:hypothetical protein
MGKTQGQGARPKQEEVAWFQKSAKLGLQQPLFCIEPLKNGKEYCI